MKNNLTSQDPPIFIIGGFFMLQYIYKIENKINPDTTSVISLI